jgi:hypothetical protein
MPPGRLNNRYCRSNYASFHDREVLPYPPNFPGIPDGKEELDHARDMLEEATSALHVQFIMCAMPRTYSAANGTASQASLLRPIARESRLR